MHPKMRNCSQASIFVEIFLPHVVNADSIIVRYSTRDQIVAVMYVPQISTKVCNVLMAFFETFPGLLS